jgi:predicted GTPase
MKRKNVIIMGAAGRDFHNFNVCFRDNPSCRVMAFTATQIPYIANRRYPQALAGSLYPRGIPIFDEKELPGLVRKYSINEVVFSYSDISHNEVMHKASLVLALGADFRFLGPDATMLKSRKPVISVCAVRTGAGKSQVTRYISGIIMDKGIKPVVVRHPMPYGNLVEQEVERFAHLDDLALHRCSIEEREEFEPLLSKGVIVFAGVDYSKILRAAEEEGDIIIWDGGNNDFPFFRPDLEITLVDPLRVGHETGYFPGEVNLRRAQVIIINKANAVENQVLQRLEETLVVVNPWARIVKTASEIRVSDASAIAGKTVLVVEDGPTITHGGMSSGAGFAAAMKFSAKEIVDPRQFAADSITEIYRKYPHIGPVLPAMGYSIEQIEDLRKTLELSHSEIVLSATPIDLHRIMTLSKPVVRVYYDLSETPEKPLHGIIFKFLENHGLAGDTGKHFT